VAGLKDELATQEIELTSVGAAWNEAEQGHQRLEAEFQKLRFACGSEFSSVLHCAFVL